MSSILVLDGIDRDRLESPPADGEGERVPGLQNLREPAMPLQAQLQVASALLDIGQPSHQDRVAGAEMLDKLAWNTYIPRDKALDSPNQCPKAALVTIPVLGYFTVSLTEQKSTLAAIRCNSSTVSAKLYALDS